MVAIESTTHMAWQENTLHVPSVGLASVMDRKETHREVVKMSCLHSEREEVGSKGKVKVVLVYIH